MVRNISRTFACVFASLNPKEFQQAFLRWVEAIQEATKKRIVAIDGKTRSHTKGTSPLHLVSAWTLENRMVLGQVKTKEKSNEITAIPELLKVLELEGCIVTIDAMGCQKEIAATIITRDADYVLGLKGNRETLHEEVKFYFEECHSSRGIVMVERERYIDGITSLDTSYYITSIRNDPGAVARAIRGHWGIENSLHWVLDIAFREDECRIRKENAPANFATLRHRALNLLRRETSLRRGIKGKRLKAGWDTVYLERILIG
jgi:predicted transposase YbfD/YdcC